MRHEEEKNRRLPRITTTLFSIFAAPRADYLKHVALHIQGTSIQTGAELQA